MNIHRPGQIRPEAEPQNKSKPEAYRLPRSGERDPYWGISRSWYYEAEQRGELKLIRLRKRGRQKGITLVPYDAMAALVKQLNETSSAAESDPAADRTSNKTEGVDYR